MWDLNDYLRNFHGERIPARARRLLGNQRVHLGLQIMVKNNETNLLKRFISRVRRV